jgi:hypothetical protein
MVESTVNTVEASEENKEQESLVMDFSGAFKNQGRKGVGMKKKKKKAPSALVGDEEAGEGNPED